jgi:hypothetical protein
VEKKLIHTLSLVAERILEYAVFVTNQGKNKWGIENLKMEERLRSE